MNKHISAIPAALLLALALFVPARAQDIASSNKPTADQAKNNLSDRDLMKLIRRDVVADKSLSTYAHNVKIIAQHGRVTLRGPVRSDQEKQTIEEYAHKYVGNGSIVNDISVKGETKTN
jgi:osmotically-inducible protein OsmY